MRNFLSSLIALVLIATGVLVLDAKSALAACAANSANLGSVSGSFNIPTAGTYRVWSRIQPDSTTTTNNSYTLEVDDVTCNVTVGDAAITAGQWTWVDYRDGTTNSKINLTLTAGTHTFKAFGRESGVMLDKIVLSGDPACVPTGNGDNCAIPPPGTPTPDTTPPSLSFTFGGVSSVPSSGIVTTVGSLVFQPAASDNVGLSSQVYKVNNQTVTLTSGSYTTPSINDDYAFTGTVQDTSSLSTTLNQTVKLRYPDVNRDNKVNTLDVLTVLRKFNATDQKGYDFDANGTVSTYDVLFVLRKWAP